MHETGVYTRDTSKKEGAIIAPLLPVNHGGTGRPLALDLRQAVNAIFYIVRTGCPWANRASAQWPAAVAQELELGDFGKALAKMYRLFQVWYTLSNLTEIFPA